MDAQALDRTYPANPTAVARARTELCDAMAPSLERGELETLRLLVSELVTNAVRHGDGNGPVEVHAHWNSEVRVEVCDRGDGFAPHRLAPREDPGGFGLYLVGCLADRWGVEIEDGTTVWFVLRRQ